jgi:hypothetical protein
MPVTNFSPKTHGFRFANSFDFPYLFNISLPLLGSRGIGDVVYGLCGGMCSAALDYFNASKGVPTVTSVENINLRLFRHLWTRQLDTLGMQVLEKLLTWAILDTRILARFVERDEIPKLRQRLDSGSPAILVLMRARGLLSLTQNHQVLAIGYTYDPATKDMTINLYDPNHPRKEPTLNLNLRSPWSGLKLSQSTGEPLRAFFVIDYNPLPPP